MKCVPAERIFQLFPVNYSSSIAVGANSSLILTASSSFRLLATHAALLAGLRCKDIDSGPHFGGFSPVQVIMGVVVIVPGANACQLVVKVLVACQPFLPQVLFDRSDKPSATAID
ncbi:MAG: hypothetical protein OEY86_11100 [Nitrospira sp.]|nr:hypothetical protein [Nitrospira sp.]